MSLGKAIEAYLGKKITHAVVTLPAHLSTPNSERPRPLMLSSVRKSSIINEPIATAYEKEARGINHSTPTIVYDTGTAHISLLSVNRWCACLFSHLRSSAYLYLRASRSWRHLEYFDNQIIGWIAK